MAKATGYKCDQCDTFCTTEDTLPPLGWLRLTVRTATHDNGGFDLCSNDCVVKFGRERVKAEKEAANKRTRGETTSVSAAVKPPAPRPTDEGLTRIPGLVHAELMSHRAGSHASFWDSYGDGFEQPVGRGFSWVCDLDEDEKRSVAAFLERRSQAIRNSGRAMSDEERRLASAIDGTVESLRG